MDDEPLDQRLGEAARDYNAPPETPREAMWERIQARRGAAPRVPPFGRARWIPWAIAAGVILAAGIGIGRRWDGQTGEVPPPVAERPTPRVSTTAYQLATQEHLSQSEAFLTLFRASLTDTGGEALASATARQLLATNRMLLDSPAGADRRTRLLLEDLELVLAEIAQLSAEPRTPDRDLIRQSIERGDVMPRLRTAVPAGAAPTQGAL